MGLIEKYYGDIVKITHNPEIRIKAQTLDLQAWNYL